MRKQMKLLAILLTILTTAVTFTQATAARPGKEIVMKLSATVDFGKDVGQGFGSLFEGRNADGRVVIGAGFADVYNTRSRCDRYTVQFFVRPAQAENNFTTEPLPQSGPDGGAYMFNCDGKVYAASHTYDRTSRSWNPEAQAWEVSPQFAPGTVQSSDALVRVGSGILKFTGSRVMFNDQPVLEAPDKGRYYNVYYAQGHLIFFHTLNADEGGFTRLHACPWSPEQKGPADLSKSVTLELTFVGETPFAYGQLGGKTLTCSNMGGLYVFDGQSWSRLRAPLRGVSYQVYSMINHYDRLLMAQYPAGELFEYDGEKVTHLKGWPPRIEGVSPSARESQTTMIYRGDLFVGVWPWGEVWRYDADAKQWISMGRMFSLPKVTDKEVHPFEQEVRDYNEKHGAKVVHNNWGQRVTGMLPLGADLMLSTSAKAPWKREKKFTFLTDEVWAQYGRFIRLTMPGNLSAALEWKDGPTQLQFIMRRDGMSIVQDGVEKGSVALDPTATGHLRDVRVKWGYGVFGSLQGKLSAEEVDY